MPKRPDPDLTGCTVLVVDDHEDARYVLTTFLEHCGARVIEAHSVPEARDLLGTVKPHIILTDVHMPRETGSDLLRWIRGHAPESLRTIPVIGISASSAPTLPREASGFTQYFSKPTDYQQVCETVAALVRARPTA